ncbi:Ig-like domain-containing protein [Rhodococcus sp. NPDC054953]
MSGMSGRRMIAAASALGVAAGFAVALGTGVANADPATVSWTDGGASFTRTLSNPTPAEGEVVTATTTVTAAGNTINWLEDVRPTCMNYKQDSVKVNGLPVPVAAVGAGTVKVQGSWDATTEQKFEFQYTVTANCTREAAQNSGVSYGGSAASGAYTTQGPGITVTKNATTTTLQPVGALKGGVQSTLTAKVTGGRANDVVKFYKGADEIGTGMLAADGVATYAWTPSNNDAGTFDITAKFLGTGFALESVSAAQNVTIEAGDQVTRTTVIVPATSLVNTDVVLEAQVEPFPGAGTVTFKNGMTVLGTVDVDANGKASLVQNFTVSGAKTITAVFSGAPGFAASTSAAQTIQVGVPGGADVATTLTLDIPAQAQAGRYIFMRANVAPKASGGTVQYFSGQEPLGNPVNVNDGLAQQSYLFSEVGVFDIRAVYSGAPGFLPSESTTTITVTDEPLPNTGGGSSDLMGMFAS